MKLTTLVTLTLLLNIIGINKSWSQDTLRTLQPGEISERAADTIKKRAFAKMVTGTEDVSSLANYVSFVPTDGKFTLSGNYFFQTKKDTAKKNNTKKRKQEFFSIGFDGSGSITSGNIATLFDGGKLNTGTSLGLRLSWRLDKPFVGTISSQTGEINEKTNALIFEREQKIDSVKNALSLLALKQTQLSLSLKEARRKLNDMRADITRLNNEISKCRTDSCKLRWTDSLFALKLKIFTETQSVASNQRDSIKVDEMYKLSLIKWGTPRTADELALFRKYGVTNNKMTLEDTLTNKIRKKYNDMIYDNEINIPIAASKVQWISIIYNWKRYAYRTYYASLPYPTALAKVDTGGHTAGLQLNLYKFDKIFKRSRLFNIALLFKKTNNLDDLSTSKLTEESAVANPLGGTTRKSSKEYNVYTDPVQLYNTIQVPVNYYRFFGKDLSFGWHVFGQADWRSTKKQVYDVGAGFIFGLNSAAVKRLFNIELFVSYKDIKRDIVDEEVTRWKQIQAGLSVAIPFMIYKN